MDLNLTIFCFTVINLFENLVNYDGFKSSFTETTSHHVFENLVNYDGFKSKELRHLDHAAFEN